LALALAVSGSAQAATNLGGCANTDISPNASDCEGFFQGNANGNSAENQADQTTALTALGAVGPFTQLEHLDISSGNTIDFATPLNGVTFISIHWGAGQGPVDDPGGGTGFYRLDLAANANLDTITSNFGSLSNAVLWGTGGGVIPEPATWAMMIMGFGGVGALIRRRRAHTALA
jgi:hypothetical protein